MKIFIGENHSCGLNYQPYMIFCELARKYQITKDPCEADIVIFAGTCSSTHYNIWRTINYMNSVLQHKKENAKVYLTGCITREFIDTEYYKDIGMWIEQNIDVVVPENRPNMLLKMVSEDDFGELDSEAFGAVIRGRDLKSIDFYISNGCLNSCAFCKTTGQRCPLESIPFEQAKNIIDRVDKSEIPQLRLIGTNVCQFGIDTRGEYLLPELLRYIETKQKIHKVSLVGFAFKDAIHNDFQEVLSSSKKDYRICGSLESGSDRILDLMRKGFTREEIINFANTIRKNKEVEIALSIISGFPTETMKDVVETSEVLRALRPTDVDICRYTNSPFVYSARYEQLDPGTIQKHAKIYQRVLTQRGVRNVIKGSGYIHN